MCKDIWLEIYRSDSCFREKFSVQKAVNQFLFISGQNFSGSIISKSSKTSKVQRTWLWLVPRITRLIRPSSLSQRELNGNKRAEYFSSGLTVFFFPPSEILHLNNGKSIFCLCSSKESLKSFSYLSIYSSVYSRPGHLCFQDLKSKCANSETKVPLFKWY